MSADKASVPANQKEPKKDAWTLDDWFADPVKDEAARKKEIKAISGLINNLVIFVSLAKTEKKYAADFPGLQTIQTETRAAKNKAAVIMKELLQSWD